MNKPKKDNNIITKIALGVSIASLVFSIVTLVRAIIIGNGVLMASILVVGTAVVVAVCAIMLYVLSNYEPIDDEAEENEDEEKDDEAEVEETAADEVDETSIEEEVDELLSQLEDKPGETE